MSPRFPLLAIALLAAVPFLQACSSGNAGLSTGSLFGGSKQVAPVAAAVEAPKPVDPSSRALFVAATSARAERCGFNFDATTLKANYLASEGPAGTPPDQLPKLEKQYDFTRASLAKQVTAQDDYCDDDRVRTIKAALNRQLAGDFSPPESARKPTGSVWSDLQSGPARREVLNPDAIFGGDRGQPKTKRVDD